MITSPSNPQIKQLRKLQQRKYRNDTGLFFLEGPRHVLQAIDLKEPIEYIVLAPSLLADPNGMKERILKHVSEERILEVSEETFKSFSSKDGPKGIAAVLTQRKLSISEIVTSGWCCVALSSVANPGNLGTILRTCDAVGVSTVILLDHSVDPYDPITLRASMGAFFNVKLITASFEELLVWKQINQLPMIGTSDHADLDYHHIRYPEKCILLMGSEREGLNEEHEKQCDQMVSIPMRGQMDSLNLAVAASIVLYEMYNQIRDVS
ncbi:MAG: RNA methyltransferase [Anaerolineaceae bacterium]|nr:RNA methyltransferase [Anaerolineaceae bacterium]